MDCMDMGCGFLLDQGTSQSCTPATLKGPPDSRNQLSGPLGTGKWHHRAQLSPAITAQQSPKPLISGACLPAARGFLSLLQSVLCRSDSPAYSRNFPVLREAFVRPASLRAPTEAAFLSAPQHHREPQALQTFAICTPAPGGMLGCPRIRL